MDGWMVYCLSLRYYYFRLAPILLFFASEKLVLGDHVTSKVDFEDRRILDDLNKQDWRSRKIDEFLRVGLDARHFIGSPLIFFFWCRQVISLCNSVIPQIDLAGMLYQFRTTDTPVTSLSRSQLKTSTISALNAKPTYNEGFLNGTTSTPATACSTHQTTATLSSPRGRSGAPPFRSPDERVVSGGLLPFPLPPNDLGSDISSGTSHEKHVHCRRIIDQPSVTYGFHEEQWRRNSTWDRSVLGSIR